MRSALPERLGSEFWFSLFMIVLCLFGAFIGFARGFGYSASVGSLLCVFYIYRLSEHVRKVRLARHLKRNPDLSRAYYSEANSHPAVSGGKIL
jgi:hypothetical protein